MKRTAAERRVLKEMERIAYGREADWPEGLPKVAERLKALEWLGRLHQMDPAEKHRVEMERRKQELAEQKQRAEERTEAAHRRAGEAQQREEACRLLVEVVGTPKGAGDNDAGE